MLATLSGDLCLLFGLGLLLLPLLAVELSRPRDGVWGAVVLLLGLVLVTSSDRLRGAPMLAVLCGSLLISRLSAEVGRARWMALSEEERQRLGSSAHWLTSLHQLGTAVSSLGEGSAESPNNSSPPVAPASPTRSGSGRRTTRAKLKRAPLLHRQPTLRRPRTPSRTDNPPIQQ